VRDYIQSECAELTMAMIGVNVDHQRQLQHPKGQLWAQIFKRILQNKPLEGLIAPKNMHTIIRRSHPIAATSRYARGVWRSTVVSVAGYVPPRTHISKSVVTSIFCKIVGICRPW
jgi:hypothetical protein